MKSKNFLLVVNIAVFAAIKIHYNLFMMSYNSAFQTIENMQVWRLITYSFTHLSLLHLCSSLIMIRIVSALNTNRLLFNYCFCAVCAGWYSIITQPDIISIGASGALLGALTYNIAVVVLKDTSILKNKRVIILIIYLIIASLLPIGNTDIHAHIGGIIGGLILAFLKEIEDFCIG